jgi:cytochrome c biogenesis protein CcmG/thiol:disulfide interchange protein DsbE
MSGRVLIRVIVAGVLLATGSVGCDRGGHPGQLDKAAPLFVVKDSQRTVDLASLRGHVVVLNFWASWCAPCLEELPSLEALQQQVPGATVLAVSTDEDSGAYRNFLMQHHVGLLTVQDPEQKSNALYGTFRYPETYIIDKGGVVRRKLIGAQNFVDPEILGGIKKLVAQ